MSYVMAWIIGVRIFVWVSPRILSDSEWDSTYHRGLHFAMMREED